jgi:hypothetical protein
MTPANSAYGGWSVSSQQETFGVDEQGRAVEGVKIYFTTKGGHAGSVFVPKTRYNVDNAKAAIMDAAAILDSVGQLKG